MQFPSFFVKNMFQNIIDKLFSYNQTESFRSDCIVSLGGYNALVAVLSCKHGLTDNLRPCR